MAHVPMFKRRICDGCELEQSAEQACKPPGADVEESLLVDRSEVCGEVVLLKVKNLNEMRSHWWYQQDLIVSA
jgi:hypothetical protein